MCLDRLIYVIFGCDIFPSPKKSLKSCHHQDDMRDFFLGIHLTRMNVGMPGNAVAQDFKSCLDVPLEVIGSMVRTNGL